MNWRPVTYPDQWVGSSSKTWSQQIQSSGIYWNKIENGQRKVSAEYQKKKKAKASPCWIHWGMIRPWNRFVAAADTRSTNVAQADSWYHLAVVQTWNSSVLLSMQSTHPGVEKFISHACSEDEKSHILTIRHVFPVCTWKSVLWLDVSFHLGQTTRNITYPYKNWKMCGRVVLVTHWQSRNHDVCRPQMELRVGCRT